MFGIRVVALVPKAVENNGIKPLIIHCIIPQQSFSEKCLDMSEVLKAFNYIRSQALNHCQFQEFIEETGEKIGP